MITQELLSIGLLIVVAKLAEGVLGRIGISSLVAYAAAGILLGPVTGVVSVDGHLPIFLEIGIFVFFFLVGLDEIDIPGLVATIRGRHFVAPVVSVIISILVCLTVTSDMLGEDFSLGLEFDKALSLAGILSLSSLGLVAKVLANKGLLRELIGLRIFTVVVIAEVVALLVVGLTIGEDARHTLSLLGMLQLLGQIAGFTIMIWIISSRVLPRVMTLLQRFLNVPQLFFGLLMGALFLVVVGGESIGLHGSLAALLFGAALSGLPNRLRQEFVPGMRSIADGLFIPLFFASAGLYFNLSFLDLPATIIIALLFVPMAGKMIASLIGTYMARLETPIVLSVGLMGKGVAEVALLLVLLESQHDWARRILAAGGYHAWLHTADAANHQSNGKQGQTAGGCASVTAHAALFCPPCLGRCGLTLRYGPDALLPRPGCNGRRLSQPLDCSESRRLSDTGWRRSCRHCFTA